MSDLRKQYFKTLKLSDPDDIGTKDDGGRTPKLIASLNRAYELRSFEIDHYWKRATYFWGFQIAIFAAFGLLWKTSDIDACQSSSGWIPISVALSGLGVLTSFASYLSARGSKFWQDNWEYHIDMLEDNLEGRLHKTVWLDNGKRSFSVSRINQYLNCYIICFWIFIFFYIGWITLGSPTFGWRLPAYAYVSAITALIIVAIVLLFGLTSKLNGTLPTVDGCHTVPVVPSGSFGRWRRRLVPLTPPPTFVRRFSPDEKRH